QWSLAVLARAESFIHGLYLQLTRDHKRLRQPVEIERLDVGHWIRRGDSGNSGHRRARTRTRKTRSPAIHRVPPSLIATSTVLGAVNRPSPMISSTPLAAVRSACI